MNIIKRYTLVERQAVAQKLQKLVKKNILKQVDVAHSCGMDWQLVHRIVRGSNLPSNAYCTVLDGFLRKFQ